VPVPGQYPDALGLFGRSSRADFELIIILRLAKADFR
jgi:hypothetical protein